jgi:hypothetical protein
LLASVLHQCERASATFAERFSLGGVRALETQFFSFSLSPAKNNPPILIACKPQSKKCARLNEASSDSTNWCLKEET